MIDDLIRQGAAQTRLDEAQVRTALSGALGLMSKHADAAKLRELFDAVPGAEPLATAGQGMMGKGGGLMGGLMKGVGGAKGAATADAMAMLSRIGKDGITQEDLRALLPVAMAFVKQQSGRNLLKEVAASIPGVGALIGG